MPSARPAGRGFFPLDKHVGLLPYSTLSPRMHQCVVRLGTELPFERVPELARLLLGVSVSVDTVRRLTEAAGVAQLECEELLCQLLRREAPDGPDGPAVQQLSADGAMVPVTGGEWAEARTIALGTVTVDDEGIPHASPVRYFSRLCSAAAFIDWVALPLHQAGTAQAGTVVAVQDGAAWLMELLDAHTLDAVRILDFPHAAEYVAGAAQAAFGPGTAETNAWLEIWLHELKHGDPDVVMAAVRGLPAPSPEAGAVRDGAAAYLRRRRDQIAYAHFQQQGYPIGSGIAESGNKLVVEERMKGAGMHWSRKNVTSMLALRGIACNGDWDTAWPELWQHLCAGAEERSRERRRARQEARRTKEEQSRPPPEPRTPILPKEPPMMLGGRPINHHHWKRGSL